MVWIGQRKTCARFGADAFSRAMRRQVNNDKCQVKHTNCLLILFQLLVLEVLKNARFLEVLKFARTHEALKFARTHEVGRSSQILKSKQCNPLICDIKEGHKASTQAKFHYFIYNLF